MNDILKQRDNSLLAKQKKKKKLHFVFLILKPSPSILIAIACTEESTIRHTYTSLSIQQLNSNLASTLI